MQKDNVHPEVQDVDSSGLSTMLNLAFALKHNTTEALIEDLLRLLHLHSPESSAVPRSQYFLEEILFGIADQFKPHLYCEVCTKYIGSLTSQDGTVKCLSCSSSTTVKTSLQEGHFFFSFSLKNQLKDILEDQGGHDLCFPAGDSRKRCDKGHM